MQNKRKNTWSVVIAVVFLLAVVLSLPPVWSRVSYHSHKAYAAVKYWIKPPSEAVFVPSTNNDAVATSVSVIITTDIPTPQPTTEPTATPSQSADEAASTPTSTPTPAPTSTLTPTPLPSSVLLSGIYCEQQKMNNCGPATLSMYLSYYGDWEDDQRTVAAALKPRLEDVNVMPYEIADFVNEHTAKRALWRYGGDLQTIRALISAGFPVMIERGYQPYSLRDGGWLGHYNLLIGYNDERETLTAHDSYLMIFPPWGGKITPDQFGTFAGFDFYYTEMEQKWRAFNYVFMVVYPPEREDEIINLLGPLATDEGACRIAYDRAMQETASLSDMREQFFAWFNAGTSQVCLEDYETAAAAYDTAFGIYPNITQSDRPYRMLWYASGPYAAYYYSARYQDVINLANQTLGYMADPVLEESYYWRALAYYALGDTTRAVADLRTSLKHHPGFAPSVDMLQQISETP